MKKKQIKPIELFKAAATAGDLIKSFRSNFGITQDEMALACKISQANLSAIEKNRREVGPKVALKLAAFMGLSPEVILFPAGYESEPEYKEVRARTEVLLPMLAKSR